MIGMNEIAECATDLPPGVCPACCGEGRSLATGEDCLVCKGTGNAESSDDPKILRAEILRLKVERAAMVRDAIDVGYASCILFVQKATIGGTPAVDDQVVAGMLAELKKTEKEIKALAGVVADGRAAQLADLLASIRKEVGLS